MAWHGMMWHSDMYKSSTWPSFHRLGLVLYKADRIESARLDSTCQTLTPRSMPYHTIPTDPGPPAIEHHFHSFIWLCSGLDNLDSNLELNLNLNLNLWLCVIVIRWILKRAQSANAALFVGALYFSDKNSSRELITKQVLAFNMI